MTDALPATVDPVFRTIAELAPTLKEAELRVLIALIALAKPPNWAVRVSTRDLRETTGCGRSAIQHAIDTLQLRNIIIVRQGTAVSASSYMLRCLQTTPMGGPAAEPPLALFQGHPRPETEPPLALFESQGGPAAEPPPNKEHACARPSIDSISDSIFDRMARAQIENFDPQDVAAAKRYMQGYSAKFGKAPHPHPPDDKITAQFLSIAPWPDLLQVIQHLMAERKECGWSYGWFTTVALQRIHGISPSEQKRQRAHLRIIQKGESVRNQPITGTQEELITDPDFTTRITNYLTERVKRL